MKSLSPLFTKGNERVSAFPKYATTLLPWTTEPVAELSENICFAHGSYERVVTHLEKEILVVIQLINY